MSCPIKEPSGRDTEKQRLHSIVSSLSHQGLTEWTDSSESELLTPAIRLHFHAGEDDDHEAENRDIKEEGEVCHNQ